MNKKKDLKNIAFSFFFDGLRNAHNKLLGPGGLVDQVMYFGHAQLVKLLSNQ